MKDLKELSFPYRNVDRWNQLSKDIIEVSSVHKMKEKLDKYRLEDRTDRT